MLHLHHMGENAEHLLCQGIFGYAEVVVQTRLCRPADMQGGEHMGLGPLHNLTDLVPVIHLFIRQMLHRRPGDNHPVIMFVLDLPEGGVEGFQVRQGSILGNMGRHMHQLNIHLQGGITEQPENLGFRLNLLGHNIENQDLQRTDVLLLCPVMGHDEDILIL